MKIAIYGVSRSGKDYLLERVVAHLMKQGVSAVHIKGSATLNNLAYQQYGIPLKETSEEKRTVLRNLFIDIVQETSLTHDVVFIDGHYSFIDDAGFNTVFTDADRYCYDHFFYLDTLTEKIIEFSRKNPRRAQDLTIQANEIDAWKNFEIKELNTICNKLGKELIILDENTQDCIEFITHWLTDFNRFNYPTVAQKLVNQFLEAKDIKHSTVILLDCDTTLSENDATYNFCDFLNVDKSLLKKIFAGDRYSSYQFFQVQKLYYSFHDTQREKAVQHAVSKIQINNQVWEFAKQQNTQAYLCAVTSGIWDIWQSKAKELRYIDSVWGNSIDKAQPFFVTPLLKKHIALAFKTYGIQVIAMGDSMIDILMLEVANQGYIVAHKKLSHAVRKYFSENPNSKIKQIFATKWHYPIEQISYKENQ